jgi:hypothetical protein
VEANAKQVLLAQLTQWRNEYLQECLPWMEAVALALAAEYQLENTEVDLTKEPWSLVGGYLRALNTERCDEAIAALEAVESLMTLSPPLSLISADADQIQAYVFETVKIPEVRGASTLVEELNLNGLRRVVEGVGLPEQVLIYQGGGGAILLVPAQVAHEVQDGIEVQFIEQTRIASITTVDHPVRLRDLLGRDHFQQVRTTLLRRLQIAKLQKEAPVHFEWLPFAQRCQACEVRPAEEEYQPTRERPRPLLCQPCALKRNKGRERQSAKRFEEFLRERLRDGAFPSYLKRSEEVEHAKAVQMLDAVRRAEDLDEIAGARGFVGVIAADGDGVGKILAQLNSLGEYQQFSQSLYETMNRSVFYQFE